MLKLVEGLRDVLCIRADASHIYWSEGNAEGNGAIKRVPRRGGETETLISGRDYPQSFVVSGDSLSWIDRDADEIGVLDIKAGSKSILSRWLFAPFELVAHERFLYWVEGIGYNREPRGAVKRLFIDGGKVEALAEDLPDPHGIAVRDDGVFWTEFDNGTIRATPLAGGEPQLIAGGLCQPFKLASQGDFIYWTEAFCNSIKRRNMLSGRIEVVYASPSIVPSELCVADDGSVYFLEERDRRAFIRRIAPIVGAEAETLAELPEGVSALHSHGGELYLFAGLAIVRL